MVPNDVTPRSFLSPFYSHIYVSPCDRFYLINCHSKRLETEEEKDKAAKADEEEDSQFFNMAQKALKRLDSKTIKSGISKTTKKTSAESPTKSKVFPLRPMVRKKLL